MKKILSILVIFTMICGTTAFAGDKFDPGKAAGKLARGITNVATCWGEYIVQAPTAMDQTPDYLTGFLYDIFRGTAYTFQRAGAGLYDILTFPFPGGTDYEPIVKPATIFAPTTEYLST